MYCGTLSSAIWDVFKWHCHFLDLNYMTLLCIISIGGRVMEKITYVTGNQAKLLSAKQILEQLGIKIDMVGDSK